MSRADDLRIVPVGICANVMLGDVMKLVFSASNNIHGGDRDLAREKIRKARETLARVDERLVLAMTDDRKVERNA